MRYTLPQEDVAALYAAMIAPLPASESSSTSKILREFAEEGWAHDWRVEDYILITDARLDEYQNGVSLRKVGEATGRRQVSVCIRPNVRTGGVSLTSAWPAMDFASLLILLEMLGFAVAPQPLVSALVPRIPKKGYISSAALDVLWYSRQREKSKISFWREHAAGIPGLRVEHTLHAGYRLHAVLDGEGVPLELTVIGPRYRQPRRLIETVCPECGATWWKGDPDSSASHRRKHKKRMAYLDPQPHPKIIEEMSAGLDFEHVDWLSQPWKHDEMYSRAVAFKRELHFDFVQWMRTGESDPDTHGFLFSLNTGAVVGACAFRLREFENESKAYGLQWVWVAPKYRRSGVFRDRWSNLRKRFGDFWIEPPVSAAMQAFVEEMGDGQLLIPPPRPDLGSKDPTIGESNDR